MEPTFYDLFIEKIETIMLEKGYGVHKHNNWDLYSFVKHKTKFQWDQDFLKEIFKTYFDKFLTFGKPIVVRAIKELFKENPTLVFNNLRHLPYFEFDFYKKLKKLTGEKNFMLYLKKRTDYYTDCSDFLNFLKEICEDYREHPEYNQIILYNLEIEKKLIFESEDNLIRTKNFCQINTDDIEYFNDLFYVEFNYKKPLFYNSPFKNNVFLLDFTLVKNTYILKYATGVESYYNLLHNVVILLNNSYLKKFFSIERFEGQFVFDKDFFQLSIFYKETFDQFLFEKYIPMILESYSDCCNNENKIEETSDFEDVYLKNFQNKMLSEKLNYKENTKEYKKTKI